MPMVNLKRTPEPGEAEGGTMLTPQQAADYGEPAYPWGLKIRLEDEELDKLGMALPAVGAVLTITCKVQVTSVRQEAEANPEPDDKGGMERCVEMQITDMDLGAPASTTREQRMYRS